LKKYKVKTVKGLWNKIKAEGFDGLQSGCILKSRTIDVDKFTVEGIFSTAVEDRHGDIVKQNFDLTSFKKNPVVLNSHNHRDIVEIIGKVEGIKVDKNKLQGKVRFAVDENPKAEIAFRLVAGGFLKAFSIGFIPKEFDKKGNIINSELLEVSFVSVPANRQTLVKSITKLYDKDNKIKSKKTKRKDNGSNVQSKNTRSKNTDAKGKSKGSKGVRKASKKDSKTTKEKVSKKLQTKILEETKNEWRFRVRQPDKFEEGSLRSITLKKSKPKIRAIIGKVKGEDKTKIQSLRFPKKEGWNKQKVEKWISEHKEDLKSFNYDIHILSLIANSISLIGESEVETRESVRAKRLRLINKAVRGLLKIKK